MHFSLAPELIILPSFDTHPHVGQSQWVASKCQREEKNYINIILSERSDKGH